MRHENALKSWIFKIISNEILLFYRKIKVERKYFIEKKYLQTISEEISDKPLVLDLLLKSLEELSSSEYEIVQMKYFDSFNLVRVKMFEGNA